MSRKTSGRQTINVIFTMLLFLVFVLCALFTVLIGGRVYENVSGRMEDNYKDSVALNYIANKVRQGDAADAVSVREVEGTSVLEIKSVFYEQEYLTWIYCLDGSIRELFTDAQSGLGLDAGLEIIECEGLKLSMEGSVLMMETAGEDGGSLTLALRSGGLRNE